MSDFVQQARQLFIDVCFNFGSVRDDAVTVDFNENLYLAVYCPPVARGIELRLVTLDDNYDLTEYLGYRESCYFQTLQDVIAEIEPINIEIEDNLSGPLPA